MSKIFFDANILLDILIPSRANHTKAIEVYTQICEDYDTLATSENILTTIEYIASRNQTDCGVIARFFDALNQNFELYAFGDIMDDSLRIYHEACEQANKIDFEDLLQLQCAIKHGCDTFITQDRELLSQSHAIEMVSLDTYKSE